MASVGNNDLPHESVDAALQKWRQGDCVLGEQWFCYRFSPELPLTEQSRVAASEGTDLTESAVLGLVVLTQTCDIVRDSSARPFIEVAPIIEVSEDGAYQVERGRYPSYASIPALRDRCFIADLNRTMTVEKPVVAKWIRTVGCRTDDERRRFADDLARKRARFAFPDDFNQFVKKLTARIQDKHDKQSPEGQALRALREIRVHAAPAWDALQVELTFWFIRHEDQLYFEGKPWNSFLDSWLSLIPPSARFTQVSGVVVMLDDLTARDYVESSRLDLDHLSTRGE